MTYCRHALPDCCVCRASCVNVVRVVCCQVECCRVAKCCQVFSSVFKCYQVLSSVVKWCVVKCCALCVVCCVLCVVQCVFYVGCMYCGVKYYNVSTVMSTRNLNAPRTGCSLLLGIELS